MNLKTFKDFMENTPLVDMSDESVEKRKNEISRIEKLAEEVWENMDNEGDDNEKRYWVRGFVVGFNIVKD